MDAILEEKLSVDEFWLAYVGDISPLEFMNRMYSPEIDACVETYVNALPDLFGIVRRHTWKESFEAPTQYRRGEIAAAICEKLEKSEDEWRPQLNQRPFVPEVIAPTPEPTPEEPLSETVGETFASLPPRDDQPQPDNFPAPDVAPEDIPTKDILDAPASPSPEEDQPQPDNIPTPDAAPEEAPTEEPQA